MSCDNGITWTSLSCIINVDGGSSTLGVATVCVGTGDGAQVGSYIGTGDGAEVGSYIGTGDGAEGEELTCVVVCRFDGAGTSIRAGLRRFGIRGVVIVTGLVGVGGGLVGI